MSNRTVRYVIFIVIVLLLQVMVLNNIQFSGYVNPYIYVMIILLLPLSFPQWLVLISAFVTGLLIDIASGSLGIHAGATVFMAFMRPNILRYISPRDGYDQDSYPSMKAYGFRWFVYYAFLMLLIHHFVLFYLEVFRFYDFFRTFVRVMLSTAFSLIFVVLAEYYRSLR